MVRQEWYRFTREILVPCRRETEREKQARQACDAFIARTMVLLSLRRDLRGCTGSAVLLRNARGVPFLVTASHLFRDDECRPVEWRPLALFAPGLEAEGVAELRDVGVDRSFAPGRVPLPQSRPRSLSRQRRCLGAGFRGRQACLLTAINARLPRKLIMKLIVRFEMAER